MKKRIIGSIFSIGMSPFAMNVTACIIVILINNSLQNTVAIWLSVPMVSLIAC